MFTVGECKRHRLRLYVGCRVHGGGWRDPEVALEGASDAETIEALHRLGRWVCDCGLVCRVGVHVPMVGTGEYEAETWGEDEGRVRPGEHARQRQSWGDPG